MVRAIAPPKAGDFTTVMIGAAAKSAQGYDPQGRLVYQTRRRQQPQSTAPPVLAKGTVTVRIIRDSTAIVRVDPASYAADTLGWAANPVRKLLIEEGGRGDFANACGATNPLPQFDQWTLLPDGTVAILRAFDYHIDWIRDGKTTSTPKMAYDWRRVTDDEKRRMLDSTHRAYDEQLARESKKPTVGLGGVVRDIKPCAFIPVELEAMADYYPPNPRMGHSAVYADRAGNVWILPATSLLSSEGLAFDVVNRKGEIFERVIVPSGRVIAGFGADGVVYLESYYGPNATRLERARIAK
jgi:hypothetical protein